MLSKSSDSKKRKDELMQTLASIGQEAYLPTAVKKTLRRSGSTKRSIRPLDGLGKRLRRQSQDEEGEDEDGEEMDEDEEEDDADYGVNYEDEDNDVLSDGNDEGPTYN